MDRNDIETKCIKDLLHKIDLAYFGFSHASKYVHAPIDIHFRRQGSTQLEFYAGIFNCAVSKLRAIGAEMEFEANTHKERE